jgi:hypothetical protein
VWAKIHRLLAARTPFSTGERPIEACRDARRPRWSACKRRSKRRSSSAQASHTMGCAGGLGGYVKAVAVRTGQDWPAREERGRDQVCGLARYLQARTQKPVRAPLGSGSSQLEHLDLEPEPVEKAEMRRRSSRRSHHLHSKRAHDRGFREPNAAARSIGARWAVTSAVRGEGAHVLEQICHVLG